MFKISLKNDKSFFSCQELLILNPFTSEEYFTPAKRLGYSVLDKGKITEELKIKFLRWKNYY